MKTVQLLRELHKDRQGNLYQITHSMPCLCKLFGTVHVLHNPKHRFTLISLLQSLSSAKVQETCPTDPEIHRCLDPAFSVVKF